MVFLRRALAEPPSHEQRAGVVTELAMVESLVDFPAAVDHFREAAKLTADRGEYAAVALACGRTLQATQSNTSEAIEMLRAAIDHAGAEHADLREQATADLIGTASLEPEFYPIARKVLDQLREGDFCGGLGSDMLRAALAHDELRRAADRERSVGLALRALEAGAIESITGQSAYYALDALRAGEAIEAALAGYERALATARRRGDLLNVGGLLGFRGWLLIDHGDLRAAESDVREGLGFAIEHGAPVHRMFLSVFLSRFLLERGELEEAERTLAELGLGEQLPDTFPFTYLLEARGKLRLAQHRPEEALSDFAAIRRIADGLDLGNPAEWPWRSDMARALHALRREGEALELVRDELDRARRWGAGRSIGVALRTLGMIEGGEVGERRLRDAVDVLAASPARLDHAKALVDLGSALRRGNERTAARELLRDGVEVAQRCGAAALVERANDELAATGARPRKILLGGVDSLTASERRVAHLASQEISNKAIAQELFVTVKTVEVHLSSVYRKLDIGSRRELAVALRTPSPEPIPIAD
jgi:DNA-binding CsgD family transcriptional regulator